MDDSGPADAELQLSGASGPGVDTHDRDPRAPRDTASPYVIVGDIPTVPSQASA